MGDKQYSDMCIWNIKDLPYPCTILTHFTWKKNTYDIIVNATDEYTGDIIWQEENSRVLLYPHISSFWGLTSLLKYDTNSEVSSKVSEAINKRVIKSNDKKTVSNTDNSWILNYSAGKGSMPDTPNILFLEYLEKDGSYITSVKYAVYVGVHTFLTQIANNGFTEIFDVTLENDLSTGHYKIFVKTKDGSSKEITWTWFGRS